MLTHKQLQQLADNECAAVKAYPVSRHLTKPLKEYAPVIKGILKTVVENFNNYYNFDTPLKFDGILNRRPVHPMGVQNYWILNKDDNYQATQTVAEFYRQTMGLMSYIAQRFPTSKYVKIYTILDLHALHALHDKFRINMKSKIVLLDANRKILTPADAIKIKDPCFP